MSDQRLATILCIEDEPDLRSEMLEELEALGYRPYGAKDGASALALLDELGVHVVDCVVCDVMMPGLSGIELIDQLRGHRAVAPTSAFIFVTALAARADMLKGLQAGADHYLVKPVDLDLLAVTLRNCLAMAARVSPSVPKASEIMGRDIHLSRRETEVLTLLGAGVKNAEIAGRLNLSPHTVNQYVKEIYRKLAINSRVEATKAAIALGLVAME